MTKPKASPANKNTPSKAKPKAKAKTKPETPAKAKVEPKANAQSAGPSEAKPPVVRILAQYIRDMSFENIIAQKGIATNQTPKINVDIGLDARKQPNEHQYEVITKLHVNATSDTQKMFVLELEYGGIVHLENVPSKQLSLFLMVEVPHQLFPFLRRIVSDVTRDGGFPSVNIEQINFMDIFRKEMSKRIEEQKQQQLAN